MIRKGLIVFVFVEIRAQPIPSETANDPDCEDFLLLRRGGVDVISDQRERLFQLVEPEQQRDDQHRAGGGGVRCFTIRQQSPSEQQDPRLLLDVHSQIGEENAAHACHSERLIRDEKSLVANNEGKPLRLVILNQGLG